MNINIEKGRRTFIFQSDIDAERLEAIAYTITASGDTEASYPEYRLNFRLKISDANNQIFLDFHPIPLGYRTRDESLESHQEALRECLRDLDGLQKIVDEFVIEAKEQVGKAMADLPAFFKARPKQP